jgi:hypothetical protein
MKMSVKNDPNRINTTFKVFIILHEIKIKILYKNMYFIKTRLKNSTFFKQF